MVLSNSAPITDAKCDGFYQHIKKDLKTDIKHVETQNKENSDQEPASPKAPRALDIFMPLW